MTRRRTGELLSLLEAAAASTSEECIHFRSYRSPVRIGDRTEGASRAVWRIAYGDPEGLFVLHTCHVDTCINIRHLYLGDHRQNMQDRLAAGHYARGADNPAARLTEVDVREIRRLRQNGVKLVDVAKQFDIHLSTVSLIAMRKKWKHVE